MAKVKIPQYCHNCKKLLGCSCVREPAINGQSCCDTCVASYNAAYLAKHKQ